MTTNRAYIIFTNVKKQMQVLRSFSHKMTSMTLIQFLSAFQLSSGTICENWRRIGKSIIPHCTLNVKYTLIGLRLRDNGRIRFVDRAFKRGTTTRRPDERT